MPDESVLPYLAGIVDGEGYVGIKRSLSCRPDQVSPGHHARVCVKMNMPAPAVQLLGARFGGRCAPENGRAMLCWQVTDAAAERALYALLPFLLVKRAQAENALALRMLQADSAQHRTKPTGRFRDFPNSHGVVRRIPILVLSDDYIAACDEHWQRAKTLNRGGDAK